MCRRRPCRLPPSISASKRCHTLSTRPLRVCALHILVNNAVSPEIIARDGKAADVANDVWEAMLRVNVLGAAWLLQKAIPQMLEQQRGSIVNISSRTAERASPRLAAYTASKGAMNALARSITLDYGRDGIRCNTVQPGYILHESASRSDPRARATSGHVHHTATTAIDVAYAVLFFGRRPRHSGSRCRSRGSSAGRGRTFD